ncbi:winged helix-turn-helix domain-containing protein [Streptacidiphilus anmyonensis]|uniref:winged helix-turn-helix domain-containing protein n=1 Tax=Streptacidiphilus anmyonensis TaxID=405782 RepID=UPI000693DE39
MSVDCAGNCVRVHTHAGLSVDSGGRTAAVDGRALRLTRREFDLLARLVGHPRRVFTRGQLLDAVWGRQGDLGDVRTVDVHIARLRAKIGGAHRDRLVTVHGVGYKYEPPRGSLRECG